MRSTLEAQPAFAPRDQESSPESEHLEPTSGIGIHIFRHSEKGKAEPGMRDEAVPLTPRGRIMALEAHGRIAGMDSSLTQAVAIGSPRIRTQETAGFVLAGPDVLTGDETLEELRAKLDGGRRYGSKIGTDARLNFSNGIVPEFTTEQTQALNEKRLLPWMVDQSDRRAIELGDTEATTYDRAAGKVAEIIEKYVTIAPRFDELVRAKKGYAPQMERFLGTHTSIPEPFLLKLVDRLRGPEERDRLLALLGAGFDPIEGFDIDIKTLPDQEQPVVEVSFSKRDPKTGEEYQLRETVPFEVIAELMAEGRASVEAAQRQRDQT